MQVRTLFLLFICLILSWHGAAGASESENTELADACASYTLSVVKTLLEHFETTNKKIDNNDVAMSIKNERINKLEEEVSQLQVNISSCSAKENLIKMYEDKDKSNEDTIESMKRSISKLTEQQVNSTCDKQSKEIEELSDKINTSANKVDACENLMAFKEKTISELEKENRNLVMKLKGTVEKNARSCVPFGNSSDVHKVNLYQGYTFQVLCNSDIAGPGWTVIQQRINGEVDFERSWNEYKNGFGLLDGDFFLGLEKIHRLTSEQPHELYIHMEDFDGLTYYAQYDEFAISDEYDEYKLSKLGRFTGNTTNALHINRNMKFTTYDRDNDDFNFWRNCAKTYLGGWWYKDCTHSNLNGKYVQYQTSDKWTIFWGPNYMKQVRMLIRPKAIENGF